MKPQEIIFKRPVRILSIRRKINIYGKDKKSFNDRKEDVAWEPIASTSGFVSEDNRLFLPERILEDPNLQTCELITIEDTDSALAGDNIDSGESAHQPEGHHCFNLHHPNKIDIFELRFDNELELYLQYGHFEVGIPSRENFKLCTLKLNMPVEIKINGKTDFSLTAGRQRTFKEQFYIYEYLGLFTNFSILKEPIEPVIKNVPAKRKVVNLMRQLW